MRIDSLAAPAMVTWQLTRDCDLACLHCCTDSAPGKAMPGELTREQSLKLAGEIAASGVPYVMVVGGEPTIVPHFLEVCRTLSAGGCTLKIESNGQKLDVEALKGLDIRSVQISLDGASQETYGRQRVHGDFAKAVDACRRVTAAGLPLEVTFAPTRLNLSDAEAVIALALELGAFRFNTGRLMKLGTAVKLWDRLEPSEAQYAGFLALLERKEKELAGRMELCFRPFSLQEEFAARVAEKAPSGTLLVRPDGKVKPSVVVDFTCADLKTHSFLEAWDAYKAAWKDRSFLAALEAYTNQDLPAMVSR